MESLLIIIMALSLGIIALLSFLAYPSGTLEQKKGILKASLLGAWIVSTIYFGPRFAVIRIPGVFDITIERALFIPLVFVLIYSLITKRTLLGKSIAIEFFMLLFATLCMMSMLFHGFLPRAPEYASPWFIFINGYLFPFIAFLYAKYVLNSFKDINTVLWFIFLGGLYLAAIAPLEFFDMRHLVYPKYINDPNIWLHLDRARGPFQNAAINGLAIVFSFSCSMFLLGAKKGAARVLQVILGVLYVLAVFFTQTRSIYLCFMVTALGLLIFYRMNISKWRAFFLPVCLFLIVAVLNLPKLAGEERKKGGVLQLEEVNIRFGLVERSLAMIADKPITGLGFGQFIPESVERYKGIVPVPAGSFTQTQHNHLLGIAAELGIPGLLTFSILVGTLLYRASRAAVILYYEPDMSYFNLTLVLLIGMVAYLLNNMFIEPSYFITINSIFYIFAGIIDRIDLELKHQVYKLREPGHLSYIPTTA